ncbi:hypothetical protein [Alkalicoccus halolimnae]|uniref:Uncharacterized protein n=1 Tax=Alkalicoccus halolimnae TaxID=1667239 RepID=A0A5C7FNA6_9BACI|nr:hypothetical protein [Alkalicoccus halolimnae]TXF86796.1 hypothetical protein FTX54_02410 [Alkalicoccus halolimnae]
MKFLIDHRNNLIHKIVCAGDRCGFNDTPVAEREFTNSHSYLELLQKQKGYSSCAHCEAATIAPLSPIKNPQ